MWADGCAGGVCHKPAEGAPEGVYQRWYWRGAAVGNRRIPWEISYVGGRGALEGCTGGVVPEPCGCPSFSATISAPRPGSRAGGVCLLQRLDTADRLRGRAHRLAFPRPSRVLHPRLPEPGIEECGAHRERFCAGRGIRRMVGRAPARCCFPNCIWLRQDSSGCAPKMAPLCRRSGGTMACHVSIVPPAGRHIVRRAPFLVSSSVGRCLYPLPNTVFSSATSALFLEFSQFCCSLECPVETVVFVLDVPHRFVGQKLFWELPALLLCSTGLWIVPFLRNIGLLALLCSTGLWMLPFLRNNGLLALLCSTGLLLLSFLRNNGLFALLCSTSLLMLPFLRNNGLFSLLLCRLEGPYLQKHSLQSLLVYTLCHGFWNHIGKLLQAPICVFFLYSGGNSS